LCTERVVIHVQLNLFSLIAAVAILRPVLLPVSSKRWDPLPYEACHNMHARPGTLYGLSIVSM
jgi:hypothetical protein